MGEKARVLLLTGAPGIGKTTVARKVASALSGKTLRGFLTGELRSGGTRTGFELTTFTGERRTLAHTSLSSPHRVGRYGVDLAALDAIVEQALALDEGVDLYLVDEIGKMECLSARFCEAMRQLLDSGRPVVATIALRAGGFVSEVKARAGVELWEVTSANRDAMPGRVLRWLGGAH